MRIGDVVVPREQGRFLHAGGCAYTHAIIGCVDPFVLVSECGDMVWSCTWEPQDVLVLCQSHPDITKRVLDRLTRTHEHLLGSR